MTQFEHTPCKIKIKNPLEPIDIKGTKDILFLLADTINQVRTGEMDVKIANCLGLLASHAVRAIENTNMEDRMKKIEESLFEGKYQEMKRVL